MTLVDCKKCKYWDVFDIKLNYINRVYKDGNLIGWNDREEWEHVETCAKGLSEIVDGKTTSSHVSNCKEFEAIGENRRQVDWVREQMSV